MTTICLEIKDQNENENFVNDGKRIIGCVGPNQHGKSNNNREAENRTLIRNGKRIRPAFL